MAARPVIERPTHEEADGDGVVSLRGVWGTRPDGFVAYGDLFVPNAMVGDTTRAFLAHVEHGQWTRSSTPRPMCKIVGYAADAQGAEWVMGPTLGEDGTNFHLSKRAAPHDWSKVPLPVRCQPWTIDSVGGDVWVTCDGRPGDELASDERAKVMRAREERPRFVLSTRAPSRVVDMQELIGTPADPGRWSQSP